MWCPRAADVGSVPRNGQVIAVWVKSKYSSQYSSRALRLDCVVMPRHCCSRLARSNSRTRESSRHGDSDWTTSGVDRCYSGNVGRLLDPGEP
jgi:hypothetical protein